MARDLYPMQAPDSMEWSHATWALTDGGTADEAKPEIGDTVYFTENSGNLTMDGLNGDSAALAAFHMDGPSHDSPYTLYLEIESGGTIPVTGDCTLCGVIQAAPTGTITVGGAFTNGAALDDDVTLELTTAGTEDFHWSGSGGAVDINATGTYTLQDGPSSYSFAFSAGTLVGANKTWILGAGGLTRAAGVLDSAGTLNITFAATTTTAEWDTTSCLGTVTFNAAVTVGPADLYCQKVAGSGTITSDHVARELFLWEPPANNFWTHTGDVTTTGTGEILIRLAAARSNATAIGGSGSNADFAITCAAGVTFTASSDITLGTGDLAVYPYEDGYCGLQVDGALTVTNVVLGHATDTDRDGRLAVATGQDHTIAGTIQRGAAATDGNQLNLDGTTTIAGAVNFAGITCTIGSTATTTFNGATTASAAGTVTLGGEVIFNANLTLANMTIDVGALLLVAGTGVTMNCASVTSLTGDEGQWRGWIVTNLATFTSPRRWRCRNVTEGSGVTYRFFHLDHFPRRRDQRFRCNRWSRV